ncbi:MAG: DUF2188 domain-containing protein [Janthinobacterium lividum]
MTEIAYHVVEHDGGWTYKVGDVFAETFRTHGEAAAAANEAAAKHAMPGTTEVISFEDADGTWHEETDDGNDRPQAKVEDDDA